MSRWLIYGANGYTGKLVAEEAVRRGLAPVLAGRSAAVEALGRELGLEARVFDLADPAAVAVGLSGMRAVLHCAGPFSRTFAPMLAGCMTVGAHYLDITGELAVFEELFARHEAIAQAGITAVSGVGFDVVPTDCLAALLHQALPGAVKLRLALQAPARVSTGTARTMIEGLGKPGFVRREGRLVEVPPGHATAMVPFGDRPALAAAISLGDLVTAFHTTGIPGIETFVRADAGAVLALKASGLLGPLLTPFHGLLAASAPWWAPGPSQAERERSRCVVWGEVEDAAGMRVAMRLSTPEAYALTVLTALGAVARLLETRPTPGAGTPAGVLGADFVLGLPGVSLERLA